MNRAWPLLVVLCLGTVTLAGCVSGDGPEDAAPAEVQVYSGDDLEALDETGGVLQVLVVDPELLPVEGATVLVSPGDLSAQTDASGVVGFGPLPEDRYTVAVERAGYTAGEAQVFVPDDDSQKVIVEIEPVGLDVPYHLTHIFQAYLMCHFVGPASALGRPNVPCAAVVDIVLATAGQEGGVTPDQWIYPFVIENPGFADLILEMNWQRQAFGVDGLLQLTSKGQLDTSGNAGVTVGGTVYGDTMAPPFWTKLTPGNLYVSNEENVFYPEPNATEQFELLVAGGGDNTSIPGTAAFIEFRPTVYVTEFYNRPAIDRFSALPDA